MEGRISNEVGVIYSPLVEIVLTDLPKSVSGGMGPPTPAALSLIQGWWNVLELGGENISKTNLPTSRAHCPLLMLAKEGLKICYPLIQGRRNKSKFGCDKT